MGSLRKLVDALLFIYFLIFAIGVPIIAGQTILPSYLYPKFLVDLKSWFLEEIDHYLASEMPHFFVGIACLELLFHWPLALMCVCGIATAKSWLNTTCLIYGSSFLTSLAAILAEFMGSRRASHKLLRFYYPFVGFALLAFVRGLLPYPGKSGKSAASHKSPALNPKKKA